MGYFVSTLWQEKQTIQDSTRKMTKWCKCKHMKGSHDLEGCTEWVGSSYYGTRGICECKG